LSYLIDTNVVSELRKGSRCNPHLLTWFDSLPDSEVYLSVLTTGEIRRGIESIRRRDPQSARVLEGWLNRLLEDYASRLLPITQEIADEWGRLNVPDPLPVIDALLAATARVHRLTLATRNIRDVEATGVPCVNPFWPQV
jgi:predicted nucleic acid-binding protein